jgi:hypothetical protein
MDAQRDRDSSELLSLLSDAIDYEDEENPTTFIWDTCQDLDDFIANKCWRVAKLMGLPILHHAEEYLLFGNFVQDSIRSTIGVYALERAVRSKQETDSASAPGPQWNNIKELLEDEAHRLGSTWSFICRNPAANIHDIMKLALGLSSHLIYG